MTMSNASLSTLSHTPKPVKRTIVPKINAESFPTFTEAVLTFLRTEHARDSTNFPAKNLGWKALNELWKLSPSHFDATILSFLQRKSAAVQQHLLLAFATTNLTHVKNLSAFLSFTLHQLKEGPPVCLFYLAGCCPEGDHCEFQHPGPTPSWMTLYKRWSVTLQDFDYVVLNAVFQHTPAEQDLIMYRLARMKLKSIKNLSALLFSLIQQLEQQAPKSAQRKATTHRQRQPLGPPPREPESEVAWPKSSTASHSTTVGSCDCSVGSESDGLSGDEGPADAAKRRGLYPADSDSDDALPADYWPRMQALQKQLSILLHDVAMLGLDVDIDMVREAAPNLTIPPALLA